jgi:hypothetical protein
LVREDVDGAAPFVTFVTFAPFVTFVIFVLISGALRDLGVAWKPRLP